MAQTSIAVRPVVMVFAGLAMMLFLLTASPARAQEQLNTATVPRGHLTELGHDRLLFALPTL